MFGLIKIKNRWLTAILLIGMVTIAAVCALMIRSCCSDTILIDGERYPLRIGNEEEIKAFCEACGYMVSDPLSDREITVPKHWNEAYRQYNDLQKSQGFDLIPYKGKPARELVYAVPDDAYLTLLVCENKIIAAHLSAVDGTEMNGVL